MYNVTNGYPENILSIKLSEIIGVNPNSYSGGPLQFDFANRVWWTHMD